MIGPLSERDCQAIKRVIFAGEAAVCVDKRLVDAKSRS